MNNDDLKYWLALARFNKIGAVRLKRLVENFPNMRTVWVDASLNELIQAGLPEKIAQELLAIKSQINPDAELEKLHQENIQAITIEHENYPALLKQIYSPPALLFYRGDLSILQQNSVAVVGTRKMSDYGRHMTQEITAGLVNAGLAITSGLALGVDAQAHITAIDNRGQTIAVLGSGLDNDSLYPAANRGLAKKIIENQGLLISEYPIRTMPLRHNFPLRNRIIAGLSLGTVVIEAGLLSGSLITAGYALEQNREIFALPGNVNHQNSAGANQLIKQGANLITSAADICDILNLQQLINFKTTRQTLPSTPAEQQILQLLSSEPLHIDRLVQLSLLPAAQVNALLTMMELKGLVKNIGGMKYATI